jgi:hypothetical protein
MTSIEIELLRHVPPAGAVALINMGGAVIRTWTLGNEWGDEMISFEVTCDSTVIQVMRSPQVYTRNVPGSIEVPAGGRHQIPFDLGDGSWQLAAPARELFARGRRIVAVYEVPPSHEASTAGVLTGHLRSRAISLVGGER